MDQNLFIGTQIADFGELSDSICDAAWWFAGESHNAEFVIFAYGWL
jgi:hypothetical protein